DPRGISFRCHDPARTMIYFCLPVRNEAATVGLVLWKIRQVLQDTPREYQLLVGDDASDDATREVLQGYEASLPLTVLRSDSPIGYAATVERLLRTALERSDRHKRDAAILWPTDYTVDPASVEEFIKKFESGADLIVGEAHLEGEPDRGQRLIRRWAPTLLGRRVRVPGVHDVVSGVAAFRLVALRQAFRDRGERWLATEGWAANAELVAWAASAARQVETVPITVRADRRQRPSRVEPWPLARALWQARGRLVAPPRSAPARDRQPRPPARAKEPVT
ncbi:MAG: glycosyltransferase, partial [Gemmatimonadetes bacterium]|nr:glycosyltransferase [Gemmatimonadota bacterium]